MQDWYRQVWRFLQAPSHPILAPRRIIARSRFRGRGRQARIDRVGACTADQGRDEILADHGIHLKLRSLRVSLVLCGKLFHYITKKALRVWVLRGSSESEHSPRYVSNPLCAQRLRLPADRDRAIEAESLLPRASKASAARTKSRCASAAEAGRRSSVKAR